MTSSRTTCARSMPAAAPGSAIDGLRPPLADPPVDGQRPDDAVALGGDHGGVAAASVSRSRSRTSPSSGSTMVRSSSRSVREVERLVEDQPTGLAGLAPRHLQLPPGRSELTGVVPVGRPARRGRPRGRTAEIEPSLRTPWQNEVSAPEAQREPGVDRRAPQLAAAADRVRADVGGADRRRVDDASRRTAAGTPARRCANSCAAPATYATPTPRCSCGAQPGRRGPRRRSRCRPNQSSSGRRLRDARASTRC